MSEVLSQRRSFGAGNEYRSFPVRSVRPTHDGRAITPAVGTADPTPFDSTRRPSDTAHPPVEQQPQVRQSTPRRGDSPYRGSVVAEDDSRRQATPRRQQPVQIINLENFESFPTSQLKTVFNSPRSLSVCAEHGIHANELLPRAPQDFLSTAVPETIAAMRYHHYEARRQEKLALLRAARADAIHAAAAAAAAEAIAEEERIGQSEGVNNITVEVISVQRRSDTTLSQPNARTPVRAGASTPPVTRVAAVSRRPVLSSNPSAPVNVVRGHQDPTVLIERSNRREVVYERAMKLRLEQEQRVIQQQIQAEQRAVSHRKACEEEKARVIELRRLKWGDAREDIEHKRRQREYQDRRRRELFLSTNGAVPYRRSNSCSQPLASASTAAVPSRPSSTVAERSLGATDLASTGVLRERHHQQRAWDVQLAKEQYFTPRQRAEKVRRASSAHA